MFGVIRSIIHGHLQDNVNSGTGSFASPASLEAEDAGAHMLAPLQELFSYLIDADPTPGDLQAFLDKFKVEGRRMLMELTLENLL